MAKTITHLKRAIVSVGLAQTYADDGALHSSARCLMEAASTNIEMRPCPACDAGNVFLTHTVRNLDARRHVECRICGMHGPVKTETVDAIVAWNELPRREQPRA